MKELSKNSIIGVIGAGTMGAGIAQVAATAGHSTILLDTNHTVLKKAEDSLKATFARLVEKGKYTTEQVSEIVQRIKFSSALMDFGKCDLIIEAIVEDLAVKQSVFAEIESIVSDDCIIASNTSSLSITSIAAACKHPQRIIGIHFFNPAPLMPLVEVIPSITTDELLAEKIKSFLSGWKKTIVIAKDTPGFIVNRLARSYYGESIRIYEEGWEGIPSGTKGFATIDWALKEIGGFKMGPFELMDLIGNDINYKVTETVWTQFFYDARYKPSLTQKRLLEAKRFGKKSGMGYYDYSSSAVKPEPLTDKILAEKIFRRVICMLINEAVDAFYYKIASRDDLDIAVKNGVNYPKGLLEWCDEIGVDTVLFTIATFHDLYLDDRYRPSVLLRQMFVEKQKFY
ncbi:MAG: 3-hydroxybutyryl-CoA dehydrogenase [Bacteroidetes bacterium]|nr:3-hydroxybutyryl-CoA dehydrogenase [Bacteroidota bacterium]